MLSTIYPGGNRKVRRHEKLEEFSWNRTIHAHGLRLQQLINFQEESQLLDDRPGRTGQGEPVTLPGHHQATGYS